MNASAHGHSSLEGECRNRKDAEGVCSLCRPLSPVKDKKRQAATTVSQTNSRLRPLRGRLVTKIRGPAALSRRFEAKLRYRACEKFNLVWGPPQADSSV